MYTVIEDIGSRDGSTSYIVVDRDTGRSGYMHVNFSLADEIRYWEDDDFCYPSIYKLIRNIKEEDPDNPVKFNGRVGEVETLEEAYNLIKFNVMLES